jgi:hypothetical protein
MLATLKSGRRPPVTGRRIAIKGYKLGKDDNFERPRLKSAASLASLPVAGRSFVYRSPAAEGLLAALNT